VKLRKWLKQIRQCEGKADLNWKLQISNTSRKVISSDGFSILVLVLPTILDKILVFKIFLLCITFKS